MGSVLKLSDIGFFRESREILRGVSWEVRRREIAAVIGPNGSGKSTLLRIACGYLWPTSGRVELLGGTLGEVVLNELRQRVGIVEATAVYPFDDDMTTLEVVVSGYFSAMTLGYIHPTPQQFTHGREMLAHVGLADRAEQLYRTLSTGQRMRALIARALVKKPELLLLDEPTAGLDLPAREAVLATLSKLHKVASSPAIVIVTHHLEELLPGTENVLLLSNDGRVIAAGAAGEVLTDANLSKAYGVAVHVTQRNGRFHAHVDPAAWLEMF